MQQVRGRQLGVQCERSLRGVPSLLLYWFGGLLHVSVSSVPESFAQAFAYWGSVFTASARSSPACTNRKYVSWTREVASRVRLRPRSRSLDWARRCNSE